MRILVPCALAFAAAFLGCAPSEESPTAGGARRDVELRARGNEPAWLLEIDDTHLVLVTDYGAQRTEVPYTRPQADGSRTTYRGSDGERQMAVVLERRDCTDSMSGEKFALTVTVTLDDLSFRGCGRPV